MAIFGRLTDFSLQEILALIGPREGMLIIDDREGGRLRIRVAHGQLIGLSREQALTDPVAIRDVVKHYASTKGKCFRFEPNRGIRSRGPSGLLSFTRLLAPRCSSPPTVAVDAVVRPQTRFVLIRGRKSVLEVPQEHFLARAEWLLTQGCNAEELAQQLDLPLPDVLTHLAALRKARRIWPLCAQDDAPARTRREPWPSLAGYLMGLFRRDASIPSAHQERQRRTGRHG